VLALIRPLAFLARLRNLEMLRNLKYRKPIKRILAAATAQPALSVASSSTLSVVSSSSAAAPSLVVRWVYC
jgi:hypothetical protein